jgi:hypothetical protein
MKNRNRIYYVLDCFDQNPYCYSRKMKRWVMLGEFYNVNLRSSLWFRTKRKAISHISNNLPKDKIFILRMFDKNKRGRKQLNEWTIIP